MTDLSTIRQQIARIPAGPGRSADEYVEDLRRTLDCMEVAETIDADREPLQLRDGDEYQRGLREGLKRAALVAREYPAQENGSLPVDPVECARSVSREIEGTILYGEASAGTTPEGYAYLAESAHMLPPNTICIPIVSVTVDQNTKWCDGRGYLSATAVSLFTGLNAQIAELRKMIEREIG